MNVLVSNLNKDKFNGLDVDIIKSINGEFEADDIVRTFSNFFFNRMFLDITAVKDYKDISNIKKLSSGIDADKIIILLNADPVVNSKVYLSQLVGLGIYNFARNLDEIMNLYNNPNSYKDVAHYQEVDDYSSIGSTSVYESVSSDRDFSRVRDNIVNNSNNADKIINNSNNNSNIINNKVDSIVSKIMDNTMPRSISNPKPKPVMKSVVLENDTKIIGIKNITTHAGATSLVYMMKQVLSKYYSVMAIEINKNDFMFYHDKDMISVNEKNISNKIREYSNYNIILIDLNDIPDSIASNICSDVYYLIEPSLLKINRLVTLNKNLLTKHNQDNILLNKSFFNKKDVNDFAFESGLKIFYNIPCMYDRINNSDILMPLFEKMGLFRKR